MSKQEAKAIIKDVEKQLKKLCPEFERTVCFDVIDDYNAPFGNRSYCTPKKTYKATWIYINLREIECQNDLLGSIAHELCHALAIHYEHYNEVIKHLLLPNSEDSMCELFSQTAESFVDIASPFVLFWLKSFLGKKAKP